MRLVCVADTHTFEQELPPIPAGDVFIHAGDLTRSGSLDELQPVLAWLEALPHRHKIVVAGNHDFCFERDRDLGASLRQHGLVYLQDGGATLEGVRFWGSPWQPAYNDWAFNLERGTLGSKWDLIPSDTQILITHGPPAGYGDRGPYPQRAGCAELLSAVERIQPNVHVFGHIHTDGGAWRLGETTLSNVTTWECERAATVLDFDPKTRAVDLVSVPPAGGCGSMAR